MNSQSAILHLQQKGIRPTANRILVYQKLANETQPVTLSSLEARLPSMDKSSIFRVLTLFVEQDVAHAFEDGRGILNYELCESEGACHHHDGHIHFYCESCRRSFCLKDIPLPEMTLPDGFVPHSFSFVIKGVCGECIKGKKIKR